VFLISADDEAVLVAVGARGAKVGLLLYEIRRAAHAVGAALRQDELDAPAPAPEPWADEPVTEAFDAVASEPFDEPVDDQSDDLSDDTVVDELDPLGLDDRQYADEPYGDDDSEESSEEPAYAGANGGPQPTPDLGAWATFSPGSSASSSGSSSTNESGSWS
jgi:hypothetical protein